MTDILWGCFGLALGLVSAGGAYAALRRLEAGDRERYGRQHDHVLGRRQ